MATIKFLLKKPTWRKSTSIVALIRFNNQRVMYSIGLSIHPDYWDDKIQRAIEKNTPELKSKNIELSGIDLIDNKSINARIEKYISFNSQLFSNYELNDIVASTKSIKEEFDKKFRDKFLPETDTLTLNQYIDKYISEITSGDRATTKGTRYTRGTIKIYDGFKNMLDEFQKTMKQVLDFEDIDLDFYRKYVSFFNKKDYSPNTIGRHIKTLKVIMGASQLQKLHNNNQYKLKEFKGISIEVKNIYLSLDELEKLYNVDLSKKKDKDKETARDVFLLGCYTALRYSDYSRIKPHHIVTTSAGTRIVQIKTKKTGEEVVIPFWHWMIDELVKKYPDGMPKTYEQKVNEIIKKVGAKAKINELVTKTIYKKGTKYDITVPKCEMIKTHTARRSAASNMYLKDIPNLDIMKITGHRTEKDFLKYIKVSKEETAERISKKFRIDKPLEIAK